MGSVPRKAGEALSFRDTAPSHLPVTPSTPCQNAATYPDWFQVAGGYAPGSCLFLGGFSGVFRSCDDGCTWKARVYLTAVSSVSPRLLAGGE